VLFANAGLLLNAPGRPASTAKAEAQDSARQTAQLADEAILRELAQASWRTHNGTDARRFIPVYDERAEYISSHVQGLVAHGRDRVIANFQSGMDLGCRLDAVEGLCVEVSSGLATLVCRHESGNSGQKVTGRNLLLLRKVGGRWLFVTHVTVV
jgi:Domain of unknown function (DUF4440)